MNKSMMLVASTAFIAATAAFGQDIPDPNPVPNADGTFTYYTGNNMQWTPSQALAVCGAGDDIVIMAGSYVQSLSCDSPDVTVRCAVIGAAPLLTGSTWAEVILWNPTEGPEANNPSAVSVSANNVTVGRPSLMTELANGNISVTTVPAADGLPEYDASATLTDICETADTLSWRAGDPDWTGDTGSQVERTALQLGQDINGDLAMQVQSRSVDKTGIIADNCAANFNCIDINTLNGFGGGVQCLGDDNTSIFNNCSISGTLSSGQDNAGNPVHGIYVAAGAPMFNGLTMQQNSGGINGIVRLAGGDATFSGCLWGEEAPAAPTDPDFRNFSPTSNGIVTMASTGSFHNCSFHRNVSRFGTIYLDSTGMATTDYVKISNCRFVDNATGDGQWGALAYCTDAVSGRSPMIVIDRCELRNRQAVGTTQGSTGFQHDIVSNYFPRYRLGADSSSRKIDANTGNGAGVNNAEDDGVPSGNPADVNGDGVVNGADLAAVLGSWG
jgi:hypothetical protein